MKWLKITVVFFLITLVKSGPTRSEEEPNPEPEPEPEPEPVPMTLTRIDRVDDTKFTVTLSANAPKDTTHLLLIVKHDKTEYPYASNEDPSLSTTYTFEENIKDLPSQPPVDFELLALSADSAPLGYFKQEGFTNPNFPGDLTSTLISDVEGLLTKELLRVAGDMGDMTIEGGTCVSNGNGDTQYCSFKSSVTNYVPCDNTIPVCDKALDPPTKAAATKGDLKSVILSYNKDSTATIKISFDPAPAPQHILDVIAYFTDGSKIQLTTDSEHYKISGSFPGTDTQNLIILQSPDGTDWTTNNVVIMDRELYATILGDDIIEGRWKILDDESTEKPTPETPAYLLTLTKDDGTVLVDSIAIDCANLETYCFGYFPITETGKYTLIVAHQTAAAGATYNELGQVESKPQEKKSSSEPELAILSRHTKRHANQLMADVNICFEHLTPTEGRSFSHYEMLIINEKGQWLKHRIMEEEEEEREGRLCFTPFAINTKDFDLTEGTKVIVSQRGVDGFTVLATGQSKLL